MGMFDLGSKRSAQIERKFSQVAAKAGEGRKPSIKSRPKNLKGVMSDSDIEGLTAEEAKERLEYLFSIADDDAKRKQLGLSLDSGKWNTHISKLQSKARSKR